MPTSGAPAASALQLSGDGPWKRVDSAPGITTPGLFYELMPKLWAYLPTKEDLDHGILWTLHDPADIPVIEAYLRAQLTYFTATTSRPMDLRSGSWDGRFEDDRLMADLVARDGAGQAIDMSLGVVLRPEVIGDARSESSAIVFDCMLDGSVFALADGTLASGSHRRVAPSGYDFRVVRDATDWKVVAMGTQPGAC